MLTRVAPNIPIHVLRHTSPSSSFHPHITPINETHPIAIVRVKHPQRAPKLHMVRTRSIRSLARLQAWQKFDKPPLNLRKIRVPRLSRRTRQSRRKTRIPSERPFFPPRLPASGKRNRTQPFPVFTLAIRAGLDGGVNVSSACDRGQRCGKVGNVFLEGVGNLSGKVGGIVCCVGIGGCREGDCPRYSRAVR